MPAARLLPSVEPEEVVEVARRFATAELAPHAARAEADEVFPRDVFRELGSLGFLGMPYPEGG